MKTEKLVLEVEMPNGVSAILSGKFLTVKGPKGEIKREVKQKLVNTKIEGINFTGYADRIDYHEDTNDKWMEIIDYKTGKPDDHLKNIDACETLASDDCEPYLRQLAA